MSMCWNIRKVNQLYYYNIYNHKMKYLAAYALLALSGKKDISTLSAT